MERVFELAKKLTALPSVSGFEDAAFEGMNEICKGMFDETYTNPVGSFTGVIRCGKKNAKALILDAHIDEIGFIVSQVFDDGFVAVTKAGGVDPRVLSAAEVIIYGKKPIKGVFTSKPPHLQSPGEQNKKIELSDLFVDTGLTGEELKENVRIGNYADAYSPLTRLANNYVMGKALDDKICIAQILRAVEMIDRSKLNVDIYCLFSAGEEIGGIGATTGAFVIDADYAVALDVCNVYMPDGKKKLENILPGKGSVITYSSTTNRALTTRLMNCAKNNNLVYQMKAEPGRTGTNAHYLQISRSGIPTTNMSMPLRYMHTPVEVISLYDVVTGSEILARFAEELGGENNG